MSPGDSLGGPGRVQPPTGAPSGAEFLLWNSLQCRLLRMLPVTQAPPSSRKEHPSWTCSPGCQSSANIHPPPPDLSLSDFLAKIKCKINFLITHCSEPGSSFSSLPLPFLPLLLPLGHHLISLLLISSSVLASLREASSWCCSPITCGPLLLSGAALQPQQAYTTWGLSLGPGPQGAEHIGGATKCSLDSGQPGGGVHRIQ